MDLLLSSENTDSENFVLIVEAACALARSVMLKLNAVSSKLKIQLDSGQQITTGK